MAEAVGAKVKMRVAVEGCVSYFLMTMPDPMLNFCYRDMALFMPSTPLSKSPARREAGMVSTFSSLEGIFRCVQSPVLDVITDTHRLFAIDMTSMSRQCRISTEKWPTSTNTTVAPELHLA